MTSIPYRDADGVELKVRAMSRLVEAIQEISLARDLDAVIRIVRTVARELVGADGASFILRDNGQCHYVDEDAISPLWKGQRFPMQACVSGWVMLNRKRAVIPDIYDDPRVPVDAYRPTFVKSLVMVPIRVASPVGAIGTYWARYYQPLPHEVELLQTLANATSLAMENVQVYHELECRVADRTRELEVTNRKLESANQELESFSYSVSHDLRNPLTSIMMCAALSESILGSDPVPGIRPQLRIIRDSALRMEALIKDLLQLAKCRRMDLKIEAVDLSALATELLDHLQLNDPQRRVQFEVRPGILVQGSRGLLSVALENLLSNAWKFTSKADQALIEVGIEERQGGMLVVFVKDNGAGFPMAQAKDLFIPFKRLHSQSDYPGTGIGLATVHMIIDRLGGRIWAESMPGGGAIFRFTLPVSG